MKIRTKDFKPFFPFKKIRKAQKKAIKFILNEYINNKKQFVVLEAGTGVGKSAIGVTVSRFLKHYNEINKIKNYLEENNIVVINTKKNLEKINIFKPKEEKLVYEPIEYMNSSYFLTTQKILQKQYVEDFKNVSIQPNKSDSSSISDIEDIIPYKMNTIESATNYKCRFYNDMCCSSGRRALKIVKKDSDFYKHCSKSCKYMEKKEIFMSNQDGVTNFQYFLAETMYSGKLKPKELLVLDECHNVYQELSGFIDIEISKNMIEKIGLDFPNVYKFTYERQKTIISDWIKKVFEPTLTKRKKHIGKQIKKEIENNNVLDEDELVNDSEDEDINKILNKYTQETSMDLSELVQQNEYLDKLACKTRRFLKYYHPKNWVINLNYEDVGNTIMSIDFKPIDISYYVKELILDYGKNILMMSATILNKDKFCELLGLKPDQIGFLSIPSPFPIENKPIYYCPVGNMNKNNIEFTFPKLIKTIKKILKIHKNEKGIIHCHNYKIVKYIKENIVSRRLLSHDSKNRDKVLKKHVKIKTPTVLLSPSMQEGVNLKDNISRFQIICKIPFPYLGDKLVKERIKKWKWWYPFETTKKLVQSIGRSIRSKDDYAKTYILDSCWENFYFENKNIFPNEFEKHFK